LTAAPSDVLGHIAISDGNPMFRQNAIKQALQMGVIEGRSVKIGATGFAFASPHARAKGTMFFVDKVWHRIFTRVQRE
jgi:hypothetical protein